MSVRKIKSATDLAKADSPPTSVLVGVPEMVVTNPNLQGSLAEQDVESTGWCYRSMYSVPQVVLFRRGEHVVVPTPSGNCMHIY